MASVGKPAAATGWSLVGLGVFGRLTLVKRSSVIVSGYYKDQQ
jgi:hypothetical protein